MKYIATNGSSTVKRNLLRAKIKNQINTALDQRNGKKKEIRVFINFRTQYLISSYPKLFGNLIFPPFLKCLLALPLS